MDFTVVLRALTIFAHAVLLTLLLGYWIAGRFPGQGPVQPSEASSQLQ